MFAWNLSLSLSLSLSLFPLWWRHHDFPLAHAGPQNWWGNESKWGNQIHRCHDITYTSGLSQHSWPQNANHFWMVFTTKIWVMFQANPRKWLSWMIFNMFVQETKSCGLLLLVATRNPVNSPVDMVNIPLFTVFYTFQLVIAGFLNHQQYHYFAVIIWMPINGVCYLFHITSYPFRRPFEFSENNWWCNPLKSCQRLEFGIWDFAYFWPFEQILGSYPP